VRFFGNVRLAGTQPLELLSLYDFVVLRAWRGATIVPIKSEGEKTNNLPGSRRSVISQFVAWYNGHPHGRVRWMLNGTTVAGSVPG